MQKLSASLMNIPIISLRTGARVGTAVTPLINPDNLQIAGWYATSVFENGVLLLPTLEVREVSRYGIAVNDADAITHADELVRYKKMLAIKFQLIGKNVVTDQKIKSGDAPEVKE